MPDQVRTDQFLSATLVGFRNPRGGRFAELTPAARQMQETAAHNVGTELVKRLRSESPRGRVHPGNGPRFAESWRAVVEATGSGAKLTVDNTDPKREFVLFPTRPHGPKQAKVLHWVDAQGNDVWAHWVKGTPGNDVLGRVNRAAGPLFRDELSAYAARVQRRLQDVFV